eukprot:5257531-Amphidinium_carterae.1
MPCFVGFFGLGNRRVSAPTGRYRNPPVPPRTGGFRHLPWRMGQSGFGTYLGGDRRVSAPTWGDRRVSAPTS